MTIFEKIKTLFSRSIPKEPVTVPETTILREMSIAPVDDKVDNSIMTREWIIKDKTAIEAGYVNHPDDLGGETNHGITKKLAEGYKEELADMFGWSGEMISMTKDMAYFIYVNEFWDLMKLDEIIVIEPAIADKLFDIAINTGPGRAGKWLQLFLNVMNNQGTLYKDIAVDGSIGPATISTLKTYISKRGERAIPRLLLGLLGLQIQHYINISDVREKNESFTYGWFSRAEHNLSYYYNRLKK